MSASLAQMYYQGYGYHSSQFMPQSMVWILFGFVLIFSLYAQFKVSGAYKKYSQVPSRGGITGRDAAAAVMSQAGIHDVDIVEVGGRLTDHYDPKNRTLALSSENYSGTSLAAVGVAAHEAGHALQHKESYSMLEFRMSLFPVTRIAAGIVPFVYILFYFAANRLSGLFLDIGIIAFAILTVFQLVTLPVEYDASRRAKRQLVALGILDQDEMPGVNAVLDAAALTYLAAFLTALLNLLSLLNNRR